MKRKRGSLSFVVPSVKLWREDVDHIISMLEEFSERVEISDRKAEFESLDELILKRGVRPKSLYFQAWGPYVSLRFDRREGYLGTWLYTNGESIEAENCFLRIKEYLLGRKRWLNVTTVIWPIVVIAFLALGLGKQAEVLSFGRIAGTMVSLSFLAYGVLFFILRFGMLYSISLSEPHERGSFLTRHGETILVGLITATIGAIVGWLASRLLP